MKKRFVVKDLSYGMITISVVSLVLFVVLLTNYAETTGFHRGYEKAHDEADYTQEKNYYMELDYDERKQYFLSDIMWSVSYYKVQIFFILAFVWLLRGLF